MGIGSLQFLSTNYPYKFSDPLVNQIEHFCNVIKKKEKPIITASIAKDTILRLLKLLNFPQKQKNWWN